MSSLVSLSAIDSKAVAYVAIFRRTERLPPAVSTPARISTSTSVNPAVVSNFRSCLPISGVLNATDAASKNRAVCEAPHGSTITNRQSLSITRSLPPGSSTLRNAVNVAETSGTYSRTFLHRSRSATSSANGIFAVLEDETRRFQCP